LIRAGLAVRVYCLSGWAIFQIESLELAGQSAYIRSRSRNTKIPSTFSTGPRDAGNERHKVRARGAETETTRQTIKHEKTQGDYNAWQATVE
jgi:hypothetical protein